ncbi:MULTISPECIES: transketolase [unclassified Kaistella]|uniref:transketolase n=1 Tax=unclassified Kaistella TaxID=2762626 RepID=UPI002736A65E|nr:MULTISPECIES: transketolase [unclassified Kaistella]MDP2453830.1 transketolase [Kaistella sp. SH11-4b]MDP2456887.1 transketolase [Kaistella sp. SH40-3]MDP2459644.1 transketolase [Kaistella sp. SH19-2b]
METKNLIQKSIDTVRILAADAVQKADSGHPGTPMALAPVGHVLWTAFMNYNPKNPEWANRDRFILSCGHACMLQYGFLYLTGYQVTMEDLKNFRQLHSIAAGHPEYGLMPGIEVTTGPLGQGFANGVGMAIAQQYMAARYNKPDFNIFDYKIYALCSDGDLMEGVSAEAASLAGHLGLGNMIYLYDDNHITIEGDTDLTFNEDVVKRFEAYGWHVQSIPDGNDLESLSAAIKNAQNETTRPSLIKVRTHIGYGSPNKHDSAAAHGSALGEEEVRLVKENFGFDPDKNFNVPNDVLDFYRNVGEQGIHKEADWNELYKNYKERHPDLAKEYEMIRDGKLPADWEKKLPVFEPGQDIATRKASGKTLNAIAEYLPQLIGGSADLSPSTDTHLDAYESFSAKHREGRNFHFGIREHAMGSILNGMALSKFIIPYGATFLIFSDYMRPPLRLAAIMKLRPIMVFTHDSIALGEDGTTHQPVEQLIGLRSIPNMTVIRPADANETAQAWRVAIEHKDGPVCIVLTRQGIPVIDQKKFAKAENLEKGAYVLSDSDDEPDVILIATGSEVNLILEAQEILKKENVKARVVSMPSWNLFEKQSDDYKEKVFPNTIRKRLAVEAGSSIGWLRYVTDDGTILGIDKFGESAPGEEVMKEYGFTVENVVNKAKVMLSKK